MNPDPKTPESNPDRPDADPPLQGEGNVAAARRHRKSVETFIDAGRVDDAARDAAPESPQQAQELKEAEQAGQSHARK